MSALAIFAVQAAIALSPGERGRLAVCLDDALRDPPTAIAAASEWLGETGGSGRALPQQCLGQAYVSLLRWEAAEAAFLAGRDAATDDGLRARLGAMAGNAALAAGRWDAALAALATAQVDAAAAGATALIGSIGADRSRALVGLGQFEAASIVLERARADDPQNAEAWLLSATLSRRMNDLPAAASLIATAGALTPGDPQVALEAGVIAVLSGDADTARGNWELVVELAPGSVEATRARDYLAQLEGDGE